MIHNELKRGKNSILAGQSTHCLPQKLKSMFFEKISKGFEQKLASFGLKSPLKDQMGKQMATAKLSQAELARDGPKSVL